MKNTLTTKRDWTSKKGVTIKAGEQVKLRFDVKGKDGVRDDVSPFLPSYVSLNTEDGRRFVVPLKRSGIKLPSMRKLSWWSFDSVAKSVFGTDVEPDGWSYDGSPSWLLALNLI
jgi:hypothetical protein